MRDTIQDISNFEDNSHSAETKLSLRDQNYFEALNLTSRGHTISTFASLPITVCTKLAY